MPEAHSVPYDCKKPEAWNGVPASQGEAMDRLAAEAVKVTGKPIPEAPGKAQWKDPPPKSHDEALDRLAVFMTKITGHHVT